ncbi:MAG: SMI1/KNR4 family protein [Oscillospiraceae bacterium]|nr:SMI1/KNR4 family protein [Oscillospiraceae bacterium]
MHWKKIFQSVNETELTFLEAINEQEIAQIEETLHVTLSGELLEVLKETNGIKENRFGCWLVGNSSEIIELYNCHCSFLKMSYTVPPHKILFFANNGCGEYFGFRIENGRISDGKVGVYYPIENEFRIVTPDFKTWVVEWHSGILST